ncbi:MAG: PIN domain-containing protein [Thermomicrobiales bacterium]|nr:PIN domain-containing protein [Thermomicrobiales bacterium]MCO5223313.1 PIN domain-containing protein [Thermomicrobiales bacterium]
MILCDSNVWLALAVLQHPSHSTALRWFERVTTPNTVLFCRATQQSFLRLITSASVLSPIGNPPLTNREAWNLYETLLTDDRIDFHVHEPPALERHWQRFAQRDTASPKLWMDAYLAAFAVAGGYQLITIDRAFSQFDGLDLILLSHVESGSDES